jgi:hypothetical protein
MLADPKDERPLHTSKKFQKSCIPWPPARLK